MKKEYEVSDGFEIGVKRFYLPISIDVRCQCGYLNQIVLDRQHYLSFPYVNVWENQGWYCEECGDELRIEVKLNLTLSVRNQEEGADE